MTKLLKRTYYPVFPIFVLFFIFCYILLCVDGDVNCMSLLFFVNLKTCQFDVLLTSYVFLFCSFIATISSLAFPPWQSGLRFSRPPFSPHSFKYPAFSTLVFSVTPIRCYIC